MFSKSAPFWETRGSAAVVISNVGTNNDVLEALPSINLPVCLQNMNSLESINAAVSSLRIANRYDSQLEKLDEHLRPLLKHPIPRLDKTQSVAFIASQLWFGETHSELRKVVDEMCFHSDVQSRRIIGVVQAYGCGKTKTGLRLADAFILLPLRLNLDSVGSVSLVDDVVSEQKRLLNALPTEPTYGQVEAFSTQCERLVNLCLLTLVALYDNCIANNILDGGPSDRFYFALLLLTDQQNVVEWCKQFFAQNKAIVHDDDQYNQFMKGLLRPAVPRNLKIVFLLDEVHMLFDNCRGYCLHRTASSVVNPIQAIADWRREQKNGHASTGHSTCTDLFYQFRLVMLNYLLYPGAPLGFVMCSTVFRIWKVLEEENSPLSRGTIEQYFRLHWFTHTEIKAAVRSMFKVSEAQLDALEYTMDGSHTHPFKKLSALGRPLFLMEFLEKLCNTIGSIVDVSEGALSVWLRNALIATEQKTMQRAREQIQMLVTNNIASDMWTTRQVVHLLYTTQRLCGGTLALSIDNSADQRTLGEIISKGVARLDVDASRFRISDAMFTEALMQRYASIADQNDAVLKVLNLNLNLSGALISHDSSQKGFLAERLLAWLAISNQLHVHVLDQNGDGSIDRWTVASTAYCAGTLRELGYGETSAAEPPVLGAIMMGELNRLLLPTTLAGPDLWMRASINGVNSVVAVQSKVESTVYSLNSFLSALATLDPIKMYGSSNAAVARSLWLPHLAHLQRMPYHRIIFSACGFSKEVQFRVREYNRARGRDATAGQPCRYIHLLNLEDIRECAGPLYSSLVGKLKIPVRGTEDAKSYVLGHEWLKVSANKRKLTTVAGIHAHCEYRNIKVGMKRKAQLISELDHYSSENLMVERLSQLDPCFSEP